MTDTQTGNQPAGTEDARAEPGHAPARAVYVYESAGIAEHEGHVPRWLWLVVISLVIWGLYYLVTYWNAPLTPA